MKTRDITRNDISELKKLYKLKTDLRFTLENSKANLIVEEEGIKGFVIIKDIGGVNELSYWHLNPEHKLILKGLIKKLGGKCATLEPENNKQRIELLKSIGFKQQSRIEGVYPNEKAVMLKLG